MKLGRLFPNDDRILIIPHESLRSHTRWVDVTKAVIRGGADALLTTPGILKKHHREIAGKIPVILTVPLEPQYVDLAVKMDAAAVKYHYFGPAEGIPWQQVNRFGMKCEEAGMPFLYEPVPMDKKPIEGGKNITEPEVILGACLKAVTNGADLLKTNYSGTSESFQKVTSRCPVPVVVLGGPLVPDRQCLEWIKGAVDGGAVGGALGRNTTTHREPEKIVKAIVKIIHEDASVEEALKVLN
jgi:DhnA family fructose-bisphosphate aldolase class Ia